MVAWKPYSAIRTMYAFRRIYKLSKLNFSEERMGPLHLNKDYPQRCVKCPGAHARYLIIISKDLNTIPRPMCSEYP